MRIVITSPPRSGNHWLRCLLTKVYGLTPQTGDAKPPTKGDAFRAWVASGKFPDGSIFHQHARFSRKLADAVEGAPAHLVTIVRDPYDAFVSYYHWVQERAADAALQRDRDRMVGKPLDHPDVLAFLADEFGSHLENANDWLHSGRAVVARYEHLACDPTAELRRITDQIGAVGAERLDLAHEFCRAENMRQRNPNLSRTIRVAKVGDSRERLSEPHLAIFRDRHGDLVRSLGYPVR